MNKKLRHILGIGVLAGMGAGAVTGLFARGAMSTYALCTHIQPRCTARDTLLLVGIFVLGGAVLGPLFLGMSQSGPGPVEVRVCVFCLLLILVMNIPVGLVQRFNQGIMSQGLAMLCAVLFALVMPVYGLSIGLFTSWLERRLLPVFKV